MKLLVGAAIGGGILIGSAHSVRAQCELSRVTGGEATPFDEFGTSVSIDGDYAVVGAPGDDDMAYSAGAAYVFERQGLEWTEQAKLLADDGALDDEFGISVAISGDRAVVGAHEHDSEAQNAGAAYVFRREGTTWEQEAKLTAFDAAVWDFFGRSVAIDGDVIAVGAPFENPSETDAGSVYVYRRAGEVWVPEGKLTALDGAANDEFGISVSVSGDWITIGAHRDDDGGVDAGSGYVFRFDGVNWAQEAKFTASDAEAGDHFGFSISASIDRILVGAYGDDDGRSDAGSAYVYALADDEWHEEAKLVAGDADSFDRFGYSVALFDTRAVVGAYLDDDAGDGAGAAYVFAREGTDWFEQDKITGSEASEGDSFGWSVSTTGETSFIGAWGAGDAGVAYAFALSPDDADGDGVLDGCDECPMGDDTIDTDGDTVADDCDACPGFDDSADTDSDGVPDDCEACQVNGLAVDDAADFQNVGMSVAIEGDFAFVGADDDNEAAQSAGAVYVLRRDGIVWSEVAKLVAGDAKGNDHLGWAAAVSDDWLLVGAPYDEDAGQDAGSAYLFKREGADWIEQTELFASDAGAYPLLGYAVDIDGDYAVVGAYGSAYVFAYDGSNWSEQTQLLPSGETEDTQFGWAVGISGERVVVGASKESAIGDNSGSAYVFRREEGGWVEEAKLEPSDAGHDVEFGVSVSINGERILIGAWGVDADAGAGYIFRREGLGWIEEGKLSAGDAEEDAGLGGSVSLDGDRALIGAFRDTDEVSLSGSAYVFQLDGSVWTQQTKLNANDPVENEWFAYSVCLNGDYAVIGAPLNSEAGKAAGTAYIFAVAGDCNATGTPDACDILDGLSEDVEGDGVPDECQLLPCEGDANGDGLVDPLDSGFVLSRFGCDVGSGDPDCDLADQNNDGVVDPLDVGFILSRFGVCL